MRLPPACYGAAEPKAKSALAHPRTAALNQNYEHDDKKRAANNPDDCGTVHFHSSLHQ
jgi:hypothetical protein